MSVLEALFHLHPMRGRTKAQLVMCEDEEPYVVKLANNPLGSRVLVCDYLATRLAHWAELPVPECRIIHIKPFLLQHRKDLLSSPMGKTPDGPCLHFGSRLVGGKGLQTVFDLFPADRLEGLAQAGHFSGMLVLDKWCSNADDRQAVFYRRRGESLYSAHFIDQGDCFGGAAWDLSADPRKGLFRSRQVYRGVRGWESFEPYLSRLVAIPPDVVHGFSQEIPPCWYAGRADLLASLVDRLLGRRRKIHEMIRQTHGQIPELFPSWTRKQVAFASIEREAPLRGGLESTS